MENIGYNYLKTNIVGGLHDFEQYYRDLFRKALIHSKKHMRIKLIYKYWKKQAKYDDDFKVAAQAYRFAKKYKGKVIIDANILSNEVIDEQLKKLGVREKSKNIEKSYTENSINAIIENFDESKEIKKCFKKQIFTKNNVYRLLSKVKNAN